MQSNATVRANSELNQPPPDLGQATPGVTWIRLSTDIPTAALSFARGKLDLRPYARSVLGAHTEAVYSRDDPLPALAELALLPYAAIKRGL